MAAGTAGREGRPLFPGSSNTGDWEDANIVVQPLPTGARKIVQRGGSYGRYLPSGHLVYIHNGTLFAAPFDLARLEVIGQPVPALEGVITGPTNGGAQFAVSDTGTLVYLSGGQGFGTLMDGPRRENDAAARDAGELEQSPLRACWPWTSTVAGNWTCGSTTGPATRCPA